MAGYVMKGYSTPAGIDSATGVSEMQRKLGVTVDGMWGPKTQDAYDKFLISQMKNNTLPAGANTAKASYAQDIYGLSLGVGKSDAGDYVMKGYITPAGVDSVQNVAEFQKKLGITVDGVWGPRTETAYRQTKTASAGASYRPVANVAVYGAAGNKAAAPEAVRYGQMSVANPSSLMLPEEEDIDNFANEYSIQEKKEEFFQQAQKEIVQIKNYYKDIKTNFVIPWTTAEFTNWILSRPLFGNEVVEGYKAYWISANRELIKQAARVYDIPEKLLAGVAWNEVGGDPVWVDDGAYLVRKWIASFQKAMTEEERNKKLREVKGIVREVLKDPYKTSFGYLSMQIEVAAETLGIPINKLDNRTANVIAEALKDPKFSIFIAAKHLADLKEVDYPNIPSDWLGDDEIATITSRYNLGAAAKRENAETYSYGQAIKKRLHYLEDLLSGKEL